MTSNRWIILFVLFFARVAMAFQFQSVAALSPLLITQYSVGLADLGFLIGLYFAPGIFFALPGGAVAARFGDKQVVAAGLVLMLIGGALAATTTDWTVFNVARFIVGAGGVILNVLMTKMVVDWFAQKDLSTAMAIFINSWPIGIALALFVLPAIAGTQGLAFAWWALFGFVAAALVAFVMVYHAPADAQMQATTLQPAKLPLAALSLAGAVWALYNTALAMVFSFGPTFLTEVGYSLANAGSLTSLFMVIFSLALPVGGIIADRTGRKDAVLMLSLISFAVLMPLAVLVPSTAFVLFCLLGALFAVGAGPAMTLPAEVLTPQSRAFGMGLFFTIYYVLMMIGPRIGGGIADAAGNAGAAILFGVALSAAAAVSLLLFRALTRR